MEGALAPGRSVRGGVRAFPRVVSAEGKVAVIKEYLDPVDVVKAGADASCSGGGDVVHPSWPQAVGSKGTAALVRDDPGLHRVLLLRA